MSAFRPALWAVLLISLACSACTSRGAMMRTSGDLSHLSSTPAPAAHRSSLSRSEVTDGFHAGARREAAPPVAARPTAYEPCAVSTMALDVDTASYVMTRQAIQQDRRVKNQVRVEEFINYFSYDYPAPESGGEKPLAVDIETTVCPWFPQEQLMRVAIRAADLPAGQRDPLGLVLCLDVSGSMDDEDKLPLIRQSLAWLLPQLQDGDLVSLIAYNRRARVLWQGGPGDHRSGFAGLAEALHRLDASGGTNGGEALERAFVEAQRFREADLQTQIFLITDGHFNVGTTRQEELYRFVQQRSEPGLSLSILGLGQSIKDQQLEGLAQHGRGSYHLIDSMREAQRQFTACLQGRYQPLVSDAKMQIFFNPKAVSSWRLVGYENRRLAATGFNDDYTGGTSLGHGQTVTALYQLRLKRGPGAVDRNPFFQQEDVGAEPLPELHLAQVRLRWQRDDGRPSQLHEEFVPNYVVPMHEAAADTRWAAAMAWFAQGLQRNYVLDEQALWRLASSAKGQDADGRRVEALSLLRQHFDSRH